ncbi:MAG: acylphosphatase [Candidatus Omnitrophica bacterium]|nr:acylphosphatase [Candidatus Omnitrophota bacterium]MDD5610009.1 acylphosphatase [Candidatus Omnitrophota bacterium]
MKRETSSHCVHVLYKGMVQGVGFRFTASSLAQNLRIKGWVKNLPGGDVELVAEQKKEVLEEFLSQINRYFSRYIHSAQIDWEIASSGFKDFQIKF